MADGMAWIVVAKEYLIHTFRAFHTIGPIALGLTTITIYLVETLQVSSLFLFIPSLLAQA
jgi:actin-related protein